MPGQLEETFEYIEIGKIVNIDYTNGSCDIAFHDITTGTRRTLPYSVPYAGKGWGILVGPEEGSMVAVGYDRANRPWILAYRPIGAYLNNDVENVSFVGQSDFPYRRPESGEIVLQSKPNSAIELNKEGDIRLETVDGTYYEINKNLETIIQQSVDTLTVTEAGTFKSGLVRRDIREETDKEQDALFGNTFGVNTAELLFSEVIGKNPEYKRDEINGLYDPTFLANAPEITAENPAITEVRFTTEEYADSNVGLDEIKLTDGHKALGKMQINRLMDLHTGTIVNELGKILRFDYNFGKGNQGHGNIYRSSKDFFFDKTNTLKSPKQSPDYEKVVTNLAKINAAIMLKLLLHTKGVDNQGSFESDTFRGALWSLLVDKEGLTKLEIPAATNLGDASGEPGRAGKSLLANLNGSLTMAVGKEKSENTSVNNVLNSEVAHSTKGRKDRSITMDAEGNVELMLGADTEKKQSLMLTTDGSIEAIIGKDTDNEQSIRITTDGGMYFKINGADINSDAIYLDITGNTKKKIEGDVDDLITGDMTKKVEGTTVFDSPNVKVGSSTASQHFVLGEVFMALFNAHTHIGNLGAPTLPPMIPMTAVQLSSKHTTE